ncbi:methyl-accepting chemotaxis protein [Aneurinibacillus sp. Ricciae_BoGa-3]|uniref:methyl-accepting chemotaxis protein n=1 Tax=Aneurinibacillus sp. Ricciae_BoGa-3 TaxID=3022697 RepID=UPI0023403C3D|nr:methyl-accepting chemotaxis protein [Aneurinibacillus sp. Ricciae_BoGa-3]WCK54512.1 methyl-accepting chemotaxis protein [Aneurinibacillus sp. Ricciae_BoGa-3]
MKFLRINHSITRKISIGFIVPFVLFALFFSTLLYQTSAYIINQQVIPGFEKTLKVYADGLGNTVGPILVKGAMDNDAQYEQLAAVLNSYQKKTGVENVYVIVKENGKAKLVGLSNSKAHNIQYPLTPEMQASFNSSAQISGIYTNQLGVHKSIFTPILGMDAILGIDMDASFITGLQKNLLIGSVLLIVLNIIIGLIVASILAKKITKPIISLTQHANALASGNLSNKITTSNEDEIGMLANSFESMREKLHTLVQKLYTSSALVGETSQTLSDASHQVSAGSQQIAAATRQVASSQNDQLGYIQEVSSMFTDTSERISSVSEKIQTMADGSLEAKNLSQQGNEQVALISDQMERIIYLGNQTAEELKRLGSRSREIADVVNIIKDIASQINLLALNASIEAARAGEAGRGFAVVAQEVRRLAEQTNSSTISIIDNIQALHTASDAVIDKNESSFKEIIRGAELIRKNGEIFETISAEVSALAEGTASIARETEEIDGRTQQAMASIQQVAAISQEEASAIKEMSASAEQQNESVTQLKTLSTGLTDLYKELEQSFNSFTMEINKEQADETEPRDFETSNLETCEPAINEEEREEVQAQ